MANFTEQEFNTIKNAFGVGIAAKLQLALSEAIPSAGTVTNVSSANSDIAVATGTTTPVLTLNKDNSGGVVGLTLLKINFKNVLNTFTSFFTNSNTAARTYTFPDKSDTVAMLGDILINTPIYLKGLTGYVDNPALALHPDGAGSFAWS